MNTPGGLLMERHTGDWNRSQSDPANLVKRKKVPSCSLHPILSALVIFSFLSVVVSHQTVDSKSTTAISIGYFRAVVSSSFIHAASMAAPRIGRVCSGRLTSMFDHCEPRPPPTVPKSSNFHTPSQAHQTRWVGGIAGNPSCCLL